MNAILAIPLPLRLAALFALGAFVGSLVNWGTYRLAWHQRLISPWSAPPEGMRNRRWTDRVPIVGWAQLSREWHVHGRGFWLRPMLVEISTGLLFALLYMWDTEWGARVIIANAAPPPPGFLTGNLPLAEHLRYVSHALVISLMLVASLIDVDEKTIPDSITVPGAVLGLLLAAAYPWSLLPANHWPLAGVLEVEFLTTVSPEPWPDDLKGLPALRGLVVALGCWTLWCGGLMPRRWNTRRGMRAAVRVLVHRLRAEVLTYRLLVLWLAGTCALLLAARKLSDTHWTALVSSLVGLAVGGGMVWLVRVLGTAALKREAMGFGDVTLMSMIGAFVGWQASLVIFFLAPLAGLVIGLLQWIGHGEREIPYGPFLCLAALATIVGWTDVWSAVYVYFSMGWLLPGVLAVCLVLMGGLLYLYRLAISRPR